MNYDAEGKITIIDKVAEQDRKQESKGANMLVTEMVELLGHFKIK